MKRDELLVTAGETIAYAEDYLDTKLEIVKLSVAEHGTKTAADLIAGAVVGVLGLFALASLSIALALVIGQAVDSYALGFTLVGVAYIVLAVAMYLLRKWLLVTPILKALLKSLFNPGPDGN